MPTELANLGDKSIVLSRVKSFFILYTLYAGRYNIQKWLICNHHMSTGHCIIVYIEVCIWTLCD